MEDVVVIGATDELGVGRLGDSAFRPGYLLQVHVCNAPSPAATSAIPIGETISREVLEVIGR